MPAEAIAGLAEAAAALICAFAEGVFLLTQLVGELIFLLFLLLSRLMGKSGSTDRPAWLANRRTGRGEILGALAPVLILLAIIGGFVAYHHATTRISVSDGFFSRPNQVTVTLFRDKGSEEVVIEKGEFTVLRGRWDRMEVRDPRYHPASVTIHGTRMDVRLEKIKTPLDSLTEKALEKAAGALLEKFVKPRKEATPSEEP